MDVPELPCPLIEKTRYGSTCRVWFAGGSATMHTLTPKVATAEYMRRLFTREIAALRRCASACVAATLDVFALGNGPRAPLCVITENLEAGTVRDMLDANTHMSRGDRAVLALGAAGSVCALHTFGLLHKCVRSNSFAVSVRGSVKLLSPELSKRVQCHRRGRAAVHAVAYVSPQLLHNPFARYRATDEVYSLGIVLWEILTGGDPFDGLAPADIAEVVMQGARDPMHGSTAALAALVDACRAYAPEARPEMCEVVQTLRLSCCAVCV